MFKIETNKLESELNRIDKRLQRSKSEPELTSSILKTSARSQPSPRNSQPDQNQKKQVKFDPSSPQTNQDNDPEDEITNLKKPAQFQIDWLMSVVFDEKDESKINKIMSLEDFDEELKPLKKKPIPSRRQSPSMNTKKKLSNSSGDVRKQRSSSASLFNRFNKSNNDNDTIYVFECKKWLSTECEDKQIERVFKVTSNIKK
jgi:hypothetical protein